MDLRNFLECSSSGVMKTVGEVTNINEIIRLEATHLKITTSINITNR